MIRTAVAFLLICELSYIEPASATTLRCRAGVVTSGDSIEDVLDRCGEPHHLERHVKAVRTTNHIGIPIVRKVEVQRWTYQREVGKFMQILVFEAGTLVAIERGPRR